MGRNITGIGENGEGDVGLVCGRNESLAPTLVGKSGG